MSEKHNKDEILEQELDGEAQVMEDVFEEQEEIIEEQQQEISKDEGEISKLKDALARSQADFDNFKKRTERDKQDMIFFLKVDILKKILPRIDDLERIIHNTPEEMREWGVYEGVLALQKTLMKDIASLGVEPFVSKGEAVDPERHEVMTQIPGEEWIIVDEFEKGYMLGDKVLRVAKVVVGNG